MIIIIMVITILCNISFLFQSEENGSSKLEDLLQVTRLGSWKAEDHFWNIPDNFRISSQFHDAQFFVC